MGDIIIPSKRDFILFIDVNVNKINYGLYYII